MISLAGHGKDPQLVQTELPLVPNVGDRIRENLNPKDGSYHLDSLIREGLFAEEVVRGQESKYWIVDMFVKDGTVRNYFSPCDCEIIERAVAPVLVEKSKSEFPLEPVFKVGDRVYQVSPDNTGVISKISRGKAVVNVGGDREVRVPLEGLHHCDPNYSPIPKKSAEEIQAEEEAAIAKAREKYLKSLALPNCESVLVEEDKSEIPIEPIFKIGDRVIDYEKFEGTITSLSNEEFTISSPTNIKCFNLELHKKPIHKLISHISTGLEESEPLVIQPESPARSRRLDIATSAKMLKPSTVQTFLKSQSLETLEKLTRQKELICIRGDSPALEPLTQEAKQDLNTPTLLYGFNISELLRKDDLDSLSSRTQLQLLITHCEQYLEDSEWSVISGTIRRSYRQLSLEVPKSGKDSLSLPTLTTNKGVKNRSSGQSKCEKWFRDKGLLQNTHCLSPQMMAVIFGFPSEWTKCLWDAQEDRKDASDRDICLGEPSTLTAVQQSSKGCCTSIAVLEISSIDEANLANPVHEIATKPRKSVVISCMDEVLGVNDFSLDERLAYLQSERDRLIASGASPKGVWLEKSRPSKRNFDQVCWKADKPHEWLGGKKSRYIGKVDSDEHKSAIAIHKAGQTLQEIEREIKSIEKN